MAETDLPGTKASEAAEGRIDELQVHRPGFCNLLFSARLHELRRVKRGKEVSKDRINFSCRVTPGYQRSGSHSPTSHPISTFRIRDFKLPARANTYIRAKFCCRVSSGTHYTIRLRSQLLRLTAKDAVDALKPSRATRDPATPQSTCRSTRYERLRTVSS